MSTITCIRSKKQTRKLNSIIRIRMLLHPILLSKKLALLKRIKERQVILEILLRLLKNGLRLHGSRISDLRRIRPSSSVLGEEAPQLGSKTLANSRYSKQGRQSSITRLQNLHSHRKEHLFAKMRITNYTRIIS